MTAGSGIVHTETIDKAAKMRLLQLWVTLPKKDRWALPRVQDLPLQHVPSLSENGVQIRLYSGELAGLTSPIQNYVPMIIADIELEEGVTRVLEIPANFNAFIYVIEGSIKVGEEEKLLRQDQTGWLNIVRDETLSELKLSTEEKTRFVLYGGKPQGDPIVSYGPFIGDTSEDIKRLYDEYRHGRMNTFPVFRISKEFNYRFSKILRAAPSEN
jgi:redox-sensitive bicupin YhaK (pirin superfamily)